MKSSHGGNIFKYATEHNIHIDSIIDCSANINPLGPSQKGLEAMKNAVSLISHYPDPENCDFINTISSVYGVEKEFIIPGNGASELLYAVCQLNGFTGCFVPAPGFSEYRLAAEAAGLPIRDTFYRLREDQENKPYFEVPYLALQTFAAKLKGQDGRIIVFLGNPNNPDGTLLDESYIHQLATMLDDANSILVIDESFIDFIGSNGVKTNSHSLRHLIKDHSNIIIIHSLTKFYAVPGLRLAVAFTSNRFKDELAKHIPTWSVNTLAQAYGVAALQDEDYIVNTQQLISEEKKYVLQRLQSISEVTVYAPTVNYVLVHIDSSKHSVHQLSQYLMDHSIFIRNCEAYTGLGQNWFRLAIKSRDINRLVLDKIDAYFSK